MKLPDILGKMQIPERNLHALIKHLELFLRLKHGHTIVKYYLLMCLNFGGKCQSRDGQTVTKTCAYV